MYFMLDGDKLGVGGQIKARQRRGSEEVGCHFRSDAGEKSVW